MELGENPASRMVSISGVESLEKPATSLLVGDARSLSRSSGNGDGGDGDGGNGDCGNGDADKGDEHMGFVAGSSSLRAVRRMLSAL